MDVDCFSLVIKVIKAGDHPVRFRLVVIVPHVSRSNHDLRPFFGLLTPQILIPSEHFNTRNQGIYICCHPFRLCSFGYGSKWGTPIKLDGINTRLDISICGPINGLPFWPTSIFGCISYCSRPGRPGRGPGLTTMLGAHTSWGRLEQGAKSTEKSTGRSFGSPVFWLIFMFIMSLIG